MKIPVETILNANRWRVLEESGLSPLPVLESFLKNAPASNRYPLALQRRIERAALEKRIGSGRRAGRDACRHAALASLVKPAKMVRSAGRPTIDDSAAVAAGVAMLMSGEVQTYAAAARAVCVVDRDLCVYDADIKRLSSKISKAVNN